MALQDEDNQAQKEEAQAREFEGVKRATLLEQQRGLAESTLKSATARKQAPAKESGQYNPNNWKNNLRNSGKSKAEQLKAVGKDAADARTIVSILRGGQPLEALGAILFTLMMAFAIGIDALSLLTGDGATVVDWIFDIMFFIALFFATVVTTGDIIGSLIGRKTIVNIAQTIVEFIPVIDLFPFHVLAVIIIVLDIKFGILDFAKKFAKPS